MRHPQNDGLRWFLASMVAAMLPLHAVVLQQILGPQQLPRARSVMPSWAVTPPADEVESPSAPDDPARGPSEAEWQAIARFESFKDAAYRGDRSAVDAGLTFFHRLADRYPDDIGVRRIDLMALEQAVYYARESGRAERARELAARFEARTRGYELKGRIATVQAAHWVDELRSRADPPSCEREARIRGELAELAAGFPDQERLQELYRLHVRAAAPNSARCDT